MNFVSPYFVSPLVRETHVFITSLPETSSETDLISTCPFRNWPIFASPCYLFPSIICTLDNSEIYTESGLIVYLILLIPMLSSFAPFLSPSVASPTSIYLYLTFPKSS